MVRVGGQVLGAGQGRTKKEAEQQAAEAAWRAITAESEGLARAENAGRTATVRGDAGRRPHGSAGALRRA